MNDLFTTTQVVSCNYKNSDISKVVLFTSQQLIYQFSVLEGTCTCQKEREKKKAPTNGIWSHYNVFPPFSHPTRILGTYIWVPGMFLKPLGQDSTHSWYVGCSSYAQSLTTVIWGQSMLLSISEEKTVTLQIRFSSYNLATDKILTF